METLNRQLAAAREEVEKPFPKEEELTGMLNRLAELNTMLNMEQKEGPEVSNEKGTAGETGRGEQAGAEQQAGTENQESLKGPEEDKNPETISREGVWTLQKIGELQKQKSSGTETVRHWEKAKEPERIGRI